ncbi:hypothetical protein Pa4123_34360 [Phytohabitans aurantiacus]|uniref:Uncharacterized protein n=1 Tax=Phytohabitans aurantiacus TaxID=3016789 RepID=A0ABQ5QW82_9ACTN|nr:hypothetical protein Pa4123_34360 [Phytohabitans aurantiacus]
MLGGSSIRDFAASVRAGRVAAEGEAAGAAVLRAADVAVALSEQLLKFRKAGEQDGEAAHAVARRLV